MHVAVKLNNCKKPILFVFLDFKTFVEIPAVFLAAGRQQGEEAGPWMGVCSHCSRTCKLCTIALIRLQRGRRSSDHQSCPRGMTDCGDKPGSDLLLWPMTVPASLFQIGKRGGKKTTSSAWSKVRVPLCPPPTRYSPPPKHILHLLQLARTRPRCGPPLRPPGSKLELRSV